LIVAERSDAAVRVVIDEWLTKLSQRDFEGALAILIPRTKWNATLLQGVLGDRSVEPRAEARFVVDWFGRARRDGTIGIAEIAASNITATFNIVETDEGLRLALEDVHAT
jgi:hypothetical protein